MNGCAQKPGCASPELWLLRRCPPGEDKEAPWSRGLDHLSSPEKLVRKRQEEGERVWDRDGTHRGTGTGCAAVERAPKVAAMRSQAGDTHRGTCVQVWRVGQRRRKNLQVTGAAEWG